MVQSPTVLKEMKKAPLTIFVVSTLLLFLIAGMNANIASAGSPKTIVVPDDFSSIQLAVDSAAEGDTVFVKRGTYHQNVSIAKSLSLVGEESENTIIIGLESSDETINFYAPSSIIIVNADDVKISGFTLSIDGYGINGHGNGFQIANNIIKVYPTGVIFYGSNGIIANNTLRDSQVGTIKCIGSNNSIIGNSIRTFEQYTQNGRLDLEGSYNTIDENHVANLNLDKADHNVVSNNNCLRFELHNCSSNTVFGNIVNGPYVHGIRLSEGSGNVFYQNIIVNNSGAGLTLGDRYSSTENNTFYHNTFMNNSEHVDSVQDSEWSKNFWDNGKEGNYYDDYKGADSNNDGIGDSPYIVQETHYDMNLQRDVTVVFFKDNYPLMSPLKKPSSVLSPSPSLTPSNSPTQQPTPFKSPSGVFSPSPSSTLSGSPTQQQPTPEITQTASIDPWSNVLYDPGPFPFLEFVLVIAIALGATVGALLYFQRRKQIS